MKATQLPSQVLSTLDDWFRKGWLEYIAYAVGIIGIIALFIAVFILLVVFLLWIL